jgi:hypothetical protein
MVFFSAEPVATPGEKIADQAKLRRVDTGEIPSFFVDRQPAMKGMSCSKFKAEYEVMSMARLRSTMPFPLFTALESLRSVAYGF